VIHSFQHPKFPEYVGQVEFYPPIDSFFASYGYALVLRVCAMKSNAQSLRNKLQDLSMQLKSTPLENMMYAINCAKDDNDPIGEINRLYQSGECQDLAESIKAILCPRLRKDEKHSAAESVGKKLVDIETDVYFNALYVELDVAIQLYKFDGTTRTIHKQNVRPSISLYVDENFNWSVLIHEKENEFYETQNIDLLRTFPFVYGESRGGASPIKAVMMETAIVRPPPEPEDPDLVIKQLIETLAGVVDRQKIIVDVDIKNDLKKIIQELHKLKSEWNLRQLEDLEKYLNSLGSCNHENKTKVFSFCGAIHCVECLKEKIIREKIERKVDVKCPCGQKVAPIDTDCLGLNDILINFGQKARANQPSTSVTSEPVGATKLNEESIQKMQPTLGFFCHICNEKILPNDSRKSIKGQSVHERCANQTTPKPPTVEISMGPAFNPIISNKPDMNLSQLSISMKRCAKCGLNTTASNILCERNHNPLCKSCAVKYSGGSCPYCILMCYYCNRPINPLLEVYYPLEGGAQIHAICYQNQQYQS